MNTVELERKVIPDKVSAFFLLFYKEEWKRFKRYKTVERAIQGYHDMLKSEWNNKFEWRIHTSVGYVTLPVVRG